MDRLQNAIDDIVATYWESRSVWELVRIIDNSLSITVSPKQVYSSHLRIKRQAQAEVDKFKR
jgi:hypothetical protein